MEALKNTINLEVSDIHVRACLHFIQCGKAFQKAARNNKWGFKTKAAQVCGVHIPLFEKEGPTTV